MRYQRSSALFKEAQRHIPGGVNSPVRAFKSVGGTPIFIKNAKGARLYDEDGNSYLDYISSWGPLILGHAYSPVIQAIKDRSGKGTSFGIPTALENEMASFALKMIPNMDKIRFVNSGTEACMSAVRLARGVTKREKIIKFKGCYHGHSDAFLIQAGSGAVTFGSPSSPGVTKGTAKDTILANYNNLEDVEIIFKEHSDKIAAIIIEPVAGNMGCIPPKEGFLEGIRSLCDQNESLLIFDEVMTGFRLARGGAQELLEIKADIATYGKVLGGGLPVGAFAARNEIMKYLAPEGPIYQAGTLSGNPLAMSAGLSMLKALHADEHIYPRLNKKTERLEIGFRDVLKNKNIPYHINRLGSMISLHFTDKAVFDFETAATGDSKRFSKYFHGMLNKGIYLPPSSYESYFLNDALTDQDIDQTVNCFADVLKDL
jgi:glutamate-1-semialdehyde 2,1-aminomutase